MAGIEGRPLRDRILTPGVARAMTAPSTILLLGAAAAGGILLGGPVIGAVAGVAAYGARVAAAVPRGRVAVDVSGLRSPWRGHVAEAVAARSRFDAVVRDARQGPLRDRLAQIGERIADGVDAALQIARRGQALEDGLRSLRPEEVERDLAAARREAASRPGGGVQLDQRITALESQLSTATRLHRVAADAAERLRLLDARMDELVARAVELSLSGDGDRVPVLGADVDDLVTEMEALRLALDETGGGPAQMGVS